MTVTTSSELGGDPRRAQDPPLRAQPERQARQERREAQRDAEGEREHLEHPDAGVGEGGVVGRRRPDGDGQEAGRVAEQADGHHDVRREHGTAGGRGEPPDLGRPAEHEQNDRGLTLRCTNRSVDALTFDHVSRSPPRPDARRTRARSTASCSGRRSSASRPRSGPAATPSAGTTGCRASRASPSDERAGTGRRRTTLGNRPEALAGDAWGGMAGAGFEPAKAEPTGLQPVPFNRSESPRAGTRKCSGRRSREPARVRRPRSPRGAGPWRVRLGRRRAGAAPRAATRAS